MSLTKVGAGWPGGPGAYLHVTLRSSISSIPDYSGIRIKDRRGQMARTDGQGATVGGQ